MQSLLRKSEANNPFRVARLEPTNTGKIQAATVQKSRIDNPQYYKNKYKKSQKKSERSEHTKTITMARKLL